MELALFLLCSFAVFASSASIPSTQTADTTPSFLNPTPTRASTYMTGTPATQSTFAPGENNGVSSVPIETIVAVVLGAVAGLGLLLTTAWILWRVSTKKKQTETEKKGEVKVEYETDGESVLVQCEKEKELEGRVN